MKAYFFPVALISLLYLSACNKDDNNPGGTTKKLTQITTTSDMDTINFEYNSSGQLILIESVETRSDFEVNGNQLHFTEYRKYESRQVADATFTLNDQGNVISGQGNFSYSLNSPYTTQFTFTYDGAGNLTKRTDARNDGMTYSYDFVWANGDIVSKTWNLNGALYLTDYHVYDTNTEDKNKVEWNKFISYTNSFFGNSEKHLLKRTYTIFPPGSVITQDFNFAFMIDADGYPKTLTITGVSNPFSDIQTYHYQ